MAIIRPIIGNIIIDIIQRPEGPPVTNNLIFTDGSNAVFTSLDNWVVDEDINS